MIAEAFIAHVLAVHLAVPEPVAFEVRELWPSENCAQAQMIGLPGRPVSWRIEYDAACWRDRPGQRVAVLAHELCHAAYDYGRSWTSLSRAEQKRAHKRTRACARQILRDHRRCKP